MTFRIVPKKATGAVAVLSNHAPSDGEPVCICKREGRVEWRGGMPFPVSDRRLNPEQACPVHGSR